MTKRFENKNVLITGGGAGLGAATARRMAEEGAHVIVLDLQAEKVEALAQELNGTAIVGSALDADVLAKAVAAADERGHLDVVVTAAGFEAFGGATEIKLDDWRAVIDINLDGALLASRVCIPSMVKRGGGAIVLVSSIGGILGSVSNVGYATAKAGLLGLNRSLAIDGAPMNIRSNAVCPGAANTEMTDRAYSMLAEMMGITSEALITKMVKPNPLKRFGKPEEIAAAIAFLASDEASYVNGAALVVDGGASIVEPMLAQLAP